MSGGGTPRVKVKTRAVNAADAFYARVKIKLSDNKDRSWGIHDKDKIYSFVTEADRDRFLKGVNKIEPVTWYDYDDKKVTMTIKCTKSAGVSVDAFTASRDAFTALYQATDIRSKKFWWGKTR